MTSPSTSTSPSGASASFDVVGVTGWLRSGTTVLSEILGSCKDAVALGELHHCWRGWVANSPCGCGRPTRDCEVWGAAIEHALPSLDDAYAQHLDELGRRLTRNRNTLALVRSGDNDAAVQEYSTALRATLQQVSVLAGASTLIDASKSGASLLLMSIVVPGRLDVVHLVRDPRGVALSQSRDLAAVWKEAGDPVAPPKRHLAQTTVEWLGGNALIAFGGRRSASSYQVARYEDLFGSPAHAIPALAASVGLDASTLEWDEGTPPAVVLREQHVIAGNVARFGSRSRALRVDDRWRSELSPAARAGIGVVALAGRAMFRPPPLNPRYRAPR